FRQARTMFLRNLAVDFGRTLCRRTIDLSLRGSGLRLFVSPNLSHRERRFGAGLRRPYSHFGASPSLSFEGHHHLRWTAFTYPIVLACRVFPEQCGRLSKSSRNSGL